MLLNCVVVAVLVSSVFRLWVTRDLTSAWRPEGTQTIRVLKNARTTQILHEKLGSQTVIAGAPWSVDDLLAMSDREFSVHFNETGMVGFTTDRDDLTLDQQIADVYGLTNGTTAGRTYIGRNAINTQPKYTFSLNLWSDGTIFDVSGQKSGTIHIDDSGLTIKGLGLAAGPAVMSQLNPIIAAVSWSAHSVAAPKLLEAGLGILSQSDLLAEITEVGASASLGTDAQGQVVNLFVPSQKFSTDDLAKLGKDMMSRVNLTTLELTNADGSSVLELFSDSSQIKSEVTTNNGQTVITLVNPHGDGFKILKDESGIFFSNRANIELNLELSSKSACLRSAHSFIQPNKILVGFNHPFASFSEIAWSQNKTKLCW